MKEVIIGIDIGNATTEAALAEILENGSVKFSASSISKTTGTKGTVDNIDGILASISKLLNNHRNQSITIKKILINDAAPVVADFAMDTITETVITDSTMIGHNPDTPGGEGLGVGYTFFLGETLSVEGNYIAVIPKEFEFGAAAKRLNQMEKDGYTITGAIVQKDEGTLINNRLHKKIPIVDEVKKIEKIPSKMMCAVEVAAPGYSIDFLSNPYGIATVFNLSAKETDYCKYIAKALIGNRSAVVIRTPKGEIRERIIPAGSMEIVGKRISKSVMVDRGAAKIMGTIKNINGIIDVHGEAGTNIGGMIENIKVSMANNCKVLKSDIRISDLFAVDTQTAIAIKGGLAEEYAMETGVAVAAMIRADMTFMERVADSLQKKLNIPIEIGGIEGEMALRGALTTPGTELPLVVIDIGAGSTDAAYMDIEGKIKSIHLAGAGNLVTMLIDSELNLNNFEMAEQIKKYPLARIDNLYRIKYENGNVRFFEQALDARYYGQIVTVLDDGQLLIIDSDSTVEKIKRIRQDAKKKVLVANVLRALDLLDIEREPCKHVILVGGSFLDFEAPNLVTEELSLRKLSAGKGNIRGTEGPRNAVATGLITKFAEEIV